MSKVGQRIELRFIRAWAHSFEPHSFGRAWAHRHEDMFGWGVFLFGTQQIDIGAGGPFCTLLDPKNVVFYKNQTLVR